MRLHLLHAMQSSQMDKCKESALRACEGGRTPHCENMHHYSIHVLRGQSRTDYCIVNSSFNRILHLKKLFSLQDRPSVIAHSCPQGVRYPVTVHCPVAG
jgi:hypothetical protein